MNDTTHATSTAPGPLPQAHALLPQLEDKAPMACTSTETALAAGALLRYLLFMANAVDDNGVNSLLSHLSEEFGGVNIPYLLESLASDVINNSICSSSTMLVLGAPMEAFMLGLGHQWQQNARVRYKPQSPPVPPAIKPTPERTDAEIAAHMRKNDIMDLALNLGVARTIYREHPELVTMPNLPEILVDPDKIDMGYKVLEFPEVRAALDAAMKPAAPRRPRTEKQELAWRERCREDEFTKLLWQARELWKKHPALVESVEWPEPLARSLRRIKTHEKEWLDDGPNTPRCLSESPAPKAKAKKATKPGRKKVSK